jgi:4,5-dihydroxyphthalate decarboxylase
MPISGRQQLKTLIGTYPHTAPLKSGALRSDRFDLAFTEIVPVWDGFDGMIREDKYDLSEMAVVTYLIARAHGKELALLPAAMIGRFQHPFAIYNGERGTLTPADLNGKRVGVRAMTTTTGVWLRGILANDYGVDLDSIDWMTFEEPHVAEYHDTSRRAPPGRKSVDMLLDGELDAVLGESSPDPRIRNLFGDPQAEAKRWHAKHNVVPINHLMVMRSADVRADPETVRAVWHLLSEGKRAAGTPADPDPVPFGIEANRKSLELISEYAFQLKLIPHRVSVDEMFAETAVLVGN